MLSSSPSTRIPRLSWATAASATTLSRLMVRSAKTISPTTDQSVDPERCGKCSASSSPTNNLMAITTSATMPASFRQGTLSNRLITEVNRIRNPTATPIPANSAWRICRAGRWRQARAMTTALSPLSSRSSRNTCNVRLIPCIPVSKPIILPLPQPSSSIQQTSHTTEQAGEGGKPEHQAHPPRIPALQPERPAQLRTGQPIEQAEHRRQQQRIDHPGEDRQLDQIDPGPHQHTGPQQHGAEGRIEPGRVGGTLLQGMSAAGGLANAPGHGQADHDGGHQCPSGQPHRKDPAPDRLAQGSGKGIGQLRHAGQGEGSVGAVETRRRG